MPTGLYSATYHGIYTDPITLYDGLFEGPPFVAGGASRPRVMLLESVWLRADLDADGVDDYLVVLNESSGGSGSFRYLAVMQATADGYANVATALLGDRLEILEIASTDDALITVTVRSTRPRDEAVASQRWRLLDSELTAVVDIAGHLTIGHEVREFAPCARSGQPAELLWVADATGGELKRAVSGFNLPAYQPLFVTLTGSVTAAPDAGFAEPFSKQITVWRLKRAEREGFGCDLELAGASYRASGVEPFWRVDVFADSLELLRPGEEAVRFKRSPDGGEGPIDRTARRFLAVDNTGARIELNLGPGRCRDSMSGSLYEWRAELTTAGAVWTGCALSALPDQ